MSVMSAPNRAAPSGRADFARLVGAEWTKLRSVRGWIGGLAAAAIVMALISLWASSGPQVGTCNGKCITGGIVLPTGPGGEGVADTFYFVHQPVTGNGTITVRVTDLTGLIGAPSRAQAAGPRGQQIRLANSHPGVMPWAKAGIIVKDGTTQGSAYAALLVTGDHGVRLQSDFTGDVAGLPGAVSPTSPRWLRLTRSGDTLTGADSRDGVHWTTVGSVHLAGLPATVQAGLAVASPMDFQAGFTASPATRATATFDHLGLASGWSGDAWHGAQIGGGPADPYHILAPGTVQRSGGNFTVSGSGDIAPAVQTGALGGGTVEATLVGGFAGLLVVIVVGAVFVTSEFRHGLIGTSLLVGPRRGRVLAAKAVVVGTAAFVAGLAAVAVAVPLGERILRADGNFFYPTGTLTDLRVELGTAALLGVTAILALALGLLLRRSVLTVTTVVVALLLPYMLVYTAVLPAGAAEWLLRVTPAAAFAIQQSLPTYHQVSAAVFIPFNGYYPLAPWAGFAVLCGWAALALGLATVKLNRSDV